MSDPRTITITTRGDDDHLEITVGADEHDAPLDQLLDGFGWVAGIVARLAVHLAGDLDRTRQHHRCHPAGLGYGPCGIGAPATVLDPSRDTGDPPAVWITVPTGDGDRWLQHIRRTLAEVVAADLACRNPDGQVVALHTRARARGRDAV